MRRAPEAEVLEERERQREHEEQQLLERYRNGEHGGPSELPRSRLPKSSPAHGHHQRGRGGGRGEDLSSRAFAKGMDSLTLEIMT